MLIFDSKRFQSTVLSGANDVRVTNSPKSRQCDSACREAKRVAESGKIALLIGQGVNTFVEAGPGKVLSGLMRQTSRDVKTLNVEDAASLEATHAALVAKIE